MLSLARSHGSMSANDWLRNNYISSQIFVWKKTTSLPRSRAAGFCFGEKYIVEVSSLIQYLGLITGRVAEKREEKALIVLYSEGPICHIFFFVCLSSLALAGMWPPLGPGSRVPGKGRGRGKGTDLCPGHALQEQQIFREHVCASHCAVSAGATLFDLHETPPGEEHHPPGFAQRTPSLGRLIRSRRRSEVASGSQLSSWGCQPAL